MKEDFFQKAYKDAIRRREAVRDAPLLLAEVKRLREMVRFLEGDLTHENYCDLHDKGMCDMITRIPCYICEQGEEE